MLSSYRVLDLTDERGAMAGFILAGLGAEVIVVEPPGGSRSGNCNRSWTTSRIRGLVLAPGLQPQEGLGDAGQRRPRGPGGRRRCDHRVGAVPGRPSAAGRRNPALVTVSITAVRPGRTQRERGRATDLAVLAAGCVLALAGDEDRPPVRMAFPQATGARRRRRRQRCLLAFTEREASGWASTSTVRPRCRWRWRPSRSCWPSRSTPPRSSASATGRHELGPLRLSLIYPAADGHVAISFVFGTAIGPFTRDSCGGCTRRASATRPPATRTRRLRRRAHRRQDQPRGVAPRPHGSVATFTRQAHQGRAVRRRPRAARAARAGDHPRRSATASSSRRSNAVLRQNADRSGTARFGSPARSPSCRPRRCLGRRPLLASASTTADRAAPGRRRASVPPATAERPLPLAGVKVLDFMWAMAGRPPPGSSPTRTRPSCGSSRPALETARTLQPFWHDGSTSRVRALQQHERRQARPDPRPGTPTREAWSSISCAGPT